MFTGIIQELARVDLFDAEAKPKAKLFIKATSFVDEPPQLGESVSICGVCLTVVSIESDVCCFELAEETIRRTKLGSLTADSFVNLERSLKIGDRIDGHFVSGHVDTCAEVKHFKQSGEWERYEFSIDAQYMKYIPEKGSVTIDGVSLTVGETTSDSFCVYIIPHTKQHTLFSKYEIGDSVNIEIDCLARYLEKLIAAK